MKKQRNLYFILITTFYFLFGQHSLGKELPCSADEKIEIKASGFFGFGANAKKEKVIGRLSSTTTPESVFERSFEIGRYRFIREASGWSIYRQDQNNNYVLRKDINFPVKVLTDHPIYVYRRDNNTLEVQRNIVDLEPTSVQILFTPKRIIIRESPTKEILNYQLCKANNSEPASSSTRSNHSGTTTPLASPAKKPAAPVGSGR